MSAKFTLSITRLFTIIFLATLTSALTYAQSSSEYAVRMTKLFEISGSEETYHAAIDQMFKGLRQQKTTIPDSVMAAYEKEFQKTSMQELIKMLQPVYEKHLSLTDINEIIRFYESPVGKKYADKTPMIMRESMQAGQQWGMKVANDFQEKMKAKGY
jgi:hypothetical protein